MNTEQEFIQAIQANPEDDSRRQVYADWLEERGDERAEYLRLEYQLPAIQKRLSELRSRIDPKWMGAVSRRRKVLLTSYSREHRINLIKLIRELTGMGLWEVRNLVDAAPEYIKFDISLAEAEVIQRTLSPYAEVAIEPQEYIPTPKGPQ